MRRVLITGQRDAPSETANTVHGSSMRSCFSRMVWLCLRGCLTRCVYWSAHKTTAEQHMHSSPMVGRHQQPPAATLLDALAACKMRDIEQGALQLITNGDYLPWADRPQIHAQRHQLLHPAALHLLLKACRAVPAASAFWREEGPPAGAAVQLRPAVWLSC